MMGEATQRIYGEMVGRAMSQQGTRFFIVADISYEPRKVWTVWADGREEALETVRLYTEWRGKREAM